MAGGRPTKYNDETLETAKDYIANYANYDDVVPSIAGLACVLGVARDTIYDWIKQPEKEEFSYTVKILLTAQERSLINGSLSNTMNPMIAKLLLAGHGHSEKQEIDMKSTDGSMTPKAYTQDQYSDAQLKLSNRLNDLD